MKMNVCFFLSLLVTAYTVEAQTVTFGKQPAQHTDVHVVAAGETLYNLSKKYHTTVEALLKLNPDITNNNLVQGKIIHVPIVKNETWNTASEVAPSKPKDHPITHKVEKGETVFSISKKFNTDVPTLLMWNDLKDASIKEGQQLIVGYELPQMKVMGPLQPDESFSEVKEAAADSHEDAKSANGVEQVKTTSNVAAENLVQHLEKGIACWTHSDYDDGNFYALHSTAPQGTEIAVKNLMNNKTVTVKVIGRLPATGDNDGMLIKLSESAAKKLNVLDEKFLVEISYKAPAEALASGTN